MLFTLLMVMALGGVIMSGLYVTVESRRADRKRRAEQSSPSTGQKNDSGAATRETAPVDLKSHAEPGMATLRDLSPKSASNHWRALRRFATPLSPAAAVLTATKADAIAIDVDNDTKADLGDTLEYTVVISNSPAMDATGVFFTDTLPDNLTFVPGSLSTTPLAIPDSYSTIGNVSITIPAGTGVLANDTDPDGVGPALTVSAGATSANGGNVTMNANGSFTYDPPAGFDGPDTFTYTLNDGEGNTDTGTVTITINGMIWFINNNPGACSSSCDGRLSHPFTTLAAFQAVNDGVGNHPDENDHIFIYESATAYTGPVTLLSGQKLIGQDATASLQTITGLTPPAGSATLPATNSGNGTIVKITSGGNAINLNSAGTSNLIRGLTVGSTTAIGINGSGFGTLTVLDVNMADSPNRTGQALALSNGTLAATFANIASTNSSAAGVALTGIAGSLTTGSTTITNPGGAGLSVGTSSATFNFANTSSTQSNGTGVNLATNTGTITFGTLNITPDSGHRGLHATDNTMTITSTGGAITTTGGGIAVEITRGTSTTPLAISQTSISASGASSGIILTRTSGSFTVTGSGGACTFATQTCDGGSIQSSTAAGVLINIASNVSLTRMKIQNSGTDGINATGVNGFTFDTGIVTDNAGVSLHDGMQFANMSGTVAITNSEINNAPHNHIRFENNNTNLAAFNLTNTRLINHFGGAGGQGNDGLLFVSQGTSVVTAVNVTSCTFQNIEAAALQPQTQDTSNIQNFTVKSSTFTTNNIAIDAAVSQTSDLTITIGGPNVADGNTFTFSNGPEAINLNTATATLAGASLTGKIQRNTIGTPGVIDSGAKQGYGIRLSIQGQAHGSVVVDNNSINEVPNAGAITMFGRNGTGGADFKITNNTAPRPTETNFDVGCGGGATPCPTMTIQAQALNGNNVCLIMSGNSAYDPESWPQGLGNSAYNLTNAASTMRLEGTNPVAATQIANTNTVTNSTPPTPDVTTFGLATVVPPGTCSGPFLARPQPNTDVAKESSAAPTLNETKEGSAAQKEDILFAGAIEKPIDDSVQSLDQRSLGAMVQAALVRWQATGISAEDMMRLQQVTFEVADLPGKQLATATSTSFKIDETAAGYGWYLDSTPIDDEEFDVAVPGQELQTTEHSPAFGRMDLMTVVMRELGVAYRHGKKTVIKGLRPLMQNTLSPAVRRLPKSQDIKLPAPPAGVSDANQSSGEQSLASQEGMAASQQEIEYLAHGRSTRRLNRAAKNTAGAGLLTAMPVAPDVNLNIGVLPASKSITIKFRAQIKDPLVTPATSVCNQGTVTADGGISVTTTDPGPPVVNGPTCTPLDVADLQLTKTDSPDPVNAGENITYTLNFKNNGPSDATAVTVTDAVPANTTFVSAVVTTGAGWTVTNPSVGGTGNVVFSKGTVPNQETAVFTIVVKVTSSVPATTVISNSATAATTKTDPDSSNNTGTATTTVQTRADLAVTKTDSPDPVTAGQDITYTINFANNGPSDAQTVTVTDAVPADTTFVSAVVTTGTGWTVTNPAVGGTGNIVFSKSTTVTSETAVFTVVVKVNTSAADGATITNNAVAASTTTDPTSGNNTGTATTTVNRRADLAVTKTDSPDPVTAGQNLTYTINFVNNGPSDASTVTVTDAVPANTTFVSAVVTTGTGWTVTNPAVGGTGNVVFSKGTVAASETAVFTVVVNVNGNAPDASTITNSATAATTTTDPDNTNNTGTATTTVINQADLSVTKSDSPDPVNAGQNITYTINFKNNGPGVGNSVTVTDAVPANTTFVSAVVTTGTGWTVTNPAVGGTGNVVFSKGTVPDQETAVFTVVVNVNANTSSGTTITNSATASNTTTDPTSGNNTGTATTTVATQADIAVTKTDSPDPVVAGTNLTYAVTITNNGPSDAQSVSLTDAVPANTTFVSAAQNTGPAFSCTNPAAGASTGNVSCTIATLAAGASATFDIVVNVNANTTAGSTITNSAVGATTTTDPDNSNNTGTATTTVASQADLAVTKTDSPDPVNAGQDITYTINFTSNGPSDASTVTVTDAVPADTTFVSAVVTTGTGWTVTNPAVGGTGNVVFSKGTVTASETAVFTVVVKVNTSAANGSTITNSATAASTATDPDSSNNTDTETTTVATQADLSVTKSDSPDPVVSGSNITYTINFTNNGPSDASTVTVTDAVPANTTFVSAVVTTGTGWTVTNPAVGGTGNVIFSKGTVAAGETAVFTIVVNVDASTANNATITNSATAATTTTDPDNTNNTGTATTTVINQADLSVTKSDSPDPVNAGNNLTYTINFANSGPGGANTVTVTDAVPANTTFVSAVVTTGTGWTVTNPAVGGTGNVVFSKGSITNGETAVFTVVVNVNASTASGTTITNSATAATTTDDPDNSNNTGTATTTVATQADIAVTKTDSPDPVVAGTNLTYAVTITNNGPSDAQSVSLTDAVPANTTFVSAAQNTGPAFSCTNPAAGASTGNVSCTIATLAAGASATFDIVVNVNANVANGSTITNSAVGATTTTDPDNSNNTGTATTTVAAQADLSVTKTDSPDPVLAGQDITYTLNFTSNGPSDAQSVTVTDAVPANTTFVSAVVTTGTGWTVTNPAVGGTGNVVFSKGTVAASETAVFTVVVKVNANAADGSTITNSATAASTTTDSNSSNDTDTETTTVATQADLSVTKTDSPDPVGAGVNVTYTITITNNGPSDAQGLQFSDTVPTDTTFVSVTVPAGWTRTDAVPAGGTGTITATATTLAAGASAQFTLVVNVNGTTPHLTVITNSATASTTTTDPDNSNNTGTTTTTVSAQPDLSVTKTDHADPVMVGEQITYTLKVKNNGPSDATGVVVTDRMPLSSTFVSATPSVGTCSPPANNRVVCQLGNMTSGTEATVSVVVQSIGNPDTIFDTASVVANESDPNPSNNEVVESTRLVGFRQFQFTPATVTGGCQNPPGRLHFTSGAPAGLVINFTDNLNAIQQIPSVTTVGGEEFVDVTAVTSIVNGEQLGTITASAGVNSIETRLRLLPVRVATLTLTPSIVKGGVQVTGKVTLSCAASQPIVVKLTSNKPGAAIPNVTSVTFNPGETIKTFKITTKRVTAQTVAIITAQSSTGGFVRANLTVKP